VDKVPVSNIGARVQKGEALAVVGPSGGQIIFPRSYWTGSMSQLVATWSQHDCGRESCARWQSAICASLLTRLDMLKLPGLVLIPNAQLWLVADNPGGYDFERAQ
jgi:hypothetical protein